MAAKSMPSEPSEFYLACRNGDVEFVKEYLKTPAATQHNINHLEPDVKSTPLHAAAYYGHKEIVQLLIEHGCDRSQTNSYGLTAYEEATNTDIRRLFQRPTSNDGTGRFMDENTVDCFDFVKRPKEDEPEAPAVAISKPKKTKTPAVQGYQTAAEKQLEIDYATTSIAMCQSKVGRLLADILQSDAPMSLKSIGNNLQELIDREITANKNPEAMKANELLKKFLSDGHDGDVKHLIRLYTLETKFYGALRQNPIPLALPLYIALETLHDRFFEGQSYRGSKMDNDEVATYKWAVSNRGSLLQTKHFTSTSINRSVAEDFATTAVGKKSDDIQTNRVVFVYSFPKKCDQAICLGRISNTQPGISEYEDEDEVLLLPWTLFQVDSVQEESPSSYTIYLTNVLLPHKNLFSSLKWSLKHPKRALKRYRQYFPEKRPETVVKQLTEPVSNVDKDILLEEHF